MLRKTVALIVGILATSIAVGLVQKLGHQLYTLPAGTDPNNVEAIKKYIETAPFMAIFFVIISYAVGALVGGFVSTKIANDGKKIYALIIGVIFLLTSIYMMVTIPSPTWFWVAGISVWGLVLAGYKFAERAKNQVKRDKRNELIN